MKNKYFGFLTLGAISLSYIILVIPIIRMPVIGYEYIMWQNALQLLRDGIGTFFYFPHPTLYLHSLTLSMKIFGITEVAARLPGVLFLIASFITAFYTVFFFNNKKDYEKGALIAALFLLLNPVSFQGSLIIDFSDSNLLLFSTSLFFLFFFKVKNDSFKRKVLILGLAYAFCLWSKITTSLAIPATVFIYYLLNKRYKDAFFITLAFTVIGFMVFTSTWFIYLLFINKPKEVLSPITYIISEGGGSVKTASFQKSSLMFSSLRIITWISPLFLLISLSALIADIKNFLNTKKFSEKLILPIFALITTLVYLYLTGGSIQGGYPKYIAPIIPVLCCYNAIYLAQCIPNLRLNKKTVYLGSLLLIISFLFYFFAIGDFVNITYKARKLYIFGIGVKSVFFELLKNYFLYLILPILVVLALSIKKQLYLSNFLTILLISSILGNFSTITKQIFANYKTGVAHGNRDLETLKKHYFNVTTVYTSTEGCIAEKSNTNFVRINALIWNEADKLLALFKKEKPDVIVYGIFANTAHQMKHSLKNTKLKSYLRKHYKISEFESFTICEKN